VVVAQMVEHLPSKEEAQYCQKYLYLFFFFFFFKAVGVQKAKQIDVREHKSQLKELSVTIAGTI
jgi:hypothetical protein